MIIHGALVTDPDLSFPVGSDPRLAFVVMADPECPSILWPTPPRPVLIVAGGPGAEAMAGHFHAGDRIRIEGWTETGVVVNATAIRPLDPLPDTPVIPADTSVLLRVTRPEAPTLN